MLSPFVDSSVDNVLRQTNPDFSQLLLEFIDVHSYTASVIVLCFTRTVSKQRISQDQTFTQFNLQFTDVCSSFQCIFRLFYFPQVVQKQTLGEVGT